MPDSSPRPVLRIRGHLAAALLILTAAITGCGGDDGTGPRADDSLRPGTYTVVFEFFQTLQTPDHIEGRHDFTFRVVAPGEGPEDFELVSSRIAPIGEPARSDYLTLANSEIELTDRRWTLRLPSAEGDFTVSLSLGQGSNGKLTTVSGCYLRMADTNVYHQASGCVVDRI